MRSPELTDCLKISFPSQDPKKVDIMIQELVELAQCNSNDNSGDAIKNEDGVTSFKFRAVTFNIRRRCRFDQHIPLLNGEIKLMFLK